MKELTKEEMRERLIADGWWPLPPEEEWHTFFDDGPVDCFKPGAPRHGKPNDDLVEAVIAGLPEHLQQPAREGRVALRPDLAVQRPKKED